jgi:lactate racemase
MSFSIPWQAWYGDTEHELAVPGGWRVQQARMADAPSAPPESILRALQRPIGSPPLRDLARRGKTAVIVVEDITRSGPTSTLLPLVLAELEAGGIKPSDTWLTIGLGGHVQMGRSALLKKLGPAIVDNYAVLQHQPYENLEFLGESPLGIPVHINRSYMAADVRLSVGTIVPHADAGFGGGSKTVAIGMAGMDTLEANHRISIQSGPITGLFPNRFRENLDDVARMAGLQFVANGVLNSRRELVGLFAGDPVKAHAAGVDLVRAVSATRLPEPADIAVLNAYPKDTDLVQVANALNAVAFDLKRALRPEGTLVIASACSEGAGMHYLISKGMRQYSPPDPLLYKVGGRGPIIYSPNVSQADVLQLFPPDTLLFHQWEGVVGELVARHGDHASMTVFPCASLQMPAQG